MNILEVIHLRMAGKGPETLAEAIRTAAGDDAGSSDVRVYRQARVEGDLLIHIHRSGADQRDEPSELGLRLASLLRGHGMVGHSVWIRGDEQNTAVEAAESKKI